jgi:hypothetical protein
MRRHHLHPDTLSRAVGRAALRAAMMNKGARAVKSPLDRLEQPAAAYA